MCIASIIAAFSRGESKPERCAPAISCCSCPSGRTSVVRSIETLELAARRVAERRRSRRRHALRSVVRGARLGRRARGRCAEPGDGVHGAHLLARPHAAGRGQALQAEARDAGSRVRDQDAGRSRRRIDGADDSWRRFGAHERRGQSRSSTRGGRSPSICSSGCRRWAVSCSSTDSTSPAAASWSTFPSGSRRRTSSQMPASTPTCRRSRAASGTCGMAIAARLSG